MIYLDYNATTPCDPEVVQEMLPYFTEKFGNASSKTHSYGWLAEQAVNNARSVIAKYLTADPTEIIFTSGATESCNLALKGVFEKYSTKGKHIITCVTEHNAVLDTCNYLEKRGALITYLNVDENGLINLAELKNAIRPDTILIAIMYANNETGVIQPVQEIAAIAKEHKVLFFSDATQAIGKVEVDVQNDQVDLMAFSGHKIYGPKGVGGLYIRRRNPRVVLTEQINGGNQERGFRSGTLNVTGIVGLGKAISLLAEKEKQEQERFLQFQVALEDAFSTLGNVHINGSASPRIPNVSNIAFEGITGQNLISNLNHQIAFSLGSACTAAVKGPSHVLTAMGLKESIIKGSIRLSFGRFTTKAEIIQVIELLEQEIKKVKIDRD